MVESTDLPPREVLEEVLWTDSSDPKTKKKNPWPPNHDDSAHVGGHLLNHLTDEGHWTQLTRPSPEMFNASVSQD